MNKRTTTLIGFAAVAVVLIAVIAIVRPTFRNTEATGAIGAVEKHHAPQIAKQDVILGNEQAKQEQKFLFADYLADSKELKSFNLAGRGAEVQARIDQRRADVNTRFYEDFDFALNAARQLGRDQVQGSSTQGITLFSREEMFSKIERLAAQEKAARESTANAAEMIELSSQLQSIAREIARARAESNKLEVVTDSDALVAGSMLQMQGRAEQLLVRADYAQAMASESEMLAAASRELATLGSRPVESLSLNVRFADMASRFEQEARTSVRNQLSRYSEDVAALGRMSALLSRNAASSVQAESLRRIVNERAVAIRADVQEISSATRSAQYASMLGESDSFSTQVKALLSEVESLGFRAVHTN